jgi:DNA-binding response OmpR family regulator/curved DNA-binding protein CbpA
VAGYVLIVESDPELQRRINEALREGRFELASEAEGAWAERSIAVRAPDAVVLDTRLADGDGFRLAEALRRDPDTQNAPIFFIASSHRGASHRAEARRRFAPAEYLPTPLDANNLLALVRQALPAGTGTGDASVVPARAPDAPDVNMLVAALDGVLSDPEQQRERRNVERAAKTLAGEKAELQGSLRRSPFARLLQRLYAQRATGSLLLLRDATKKEATKKIVTFVDGYPVSVKSNVLAECLGQILVDRKLITEKALTESVARMQREKRQQGQILVEMGALSPYNLQRALVEQVEAKLFEIFSWPDGKFMFKESAPGAAEASALRPERPPAALILEGIRRHYDDARQRAVLDAFAGQAVTLTSDPQLRLQDITTDPNDLAFIHGIGTERLDAVIDHASIPREKARLLLVALAEAGMLTPADGVSARRRGVPTPIAPTFSPASGVVAAVAPAQPSGPLSGGQLAMIAETVRTQDYFWTLGVERDASPTEIDRAYDSHARSFHADRYRSSGEEDRRIAQEVFDRLGEAHRVLRDPARRRSYLAKLERESEGGVVTAVDAGEITAPEPVAPTPSASASPWVPTHPPANGATSASNAAARALYEAGLDHLRGRRHHEAVEAFRQAARLVPNEAEYRASLGWALFREAPADARAGRAALAELRRAVQLDARNRSAAEYLAQIYAQTGQPELAIRELERLLAIDPTAAEAAEELRRLRAAT